MVWHIIHWQQSMHVSVANGRTLHVNTIVYWMTLDGTTWPISMEQVDLELIVMMLMWRFHGMQ